MEPLCFDVQGGLFILLLQPGGLLPASLGLLQLAKLMLQ